MTIMSYKMLRLFIVIVSVSGYFTLLTQHMHICMYTYTHPCTPTHTIYIYIYIDTD